MSEILDILLAGTARNVQKEPPTKQIKIFRLSQLCGKPVILDLKALSYDKAVSLADAKDMDIKIMLEGVTAPDLKDVRLAVKYGLLEEGESWCTHGVLHKDLITAMFTAGEIRSLSETIQILSGYNVATLSTVKKN